MVCALRRRVHYYETDRMGVVHHSTELRLVDTYWSDHCRHTTFGTHIDSVQIEDEDVAGAYQEYLAGRVEV
ncbi:MAG: hypothetical protein LIO42_03890, partial [Oscillospiraceae bacterium]|nr:hypothetical protein [Oscillospiraceae bacterium]